MDSIFLLVEENREALLEQMMQSFGCAYICLWSHLPPPPNLLMALDGLYYGSLGRPLFDEYRQSAYYGSGFRRIPGLAFENSNSYMEIKLHDFQRLVSSQVQLQFYQEAGIKTIVVMGCDKGEIELGMSSDIQGINCRIHKSQGDKMTLIPYENVNLLGNGENPFEPADRIEGSGGSDQNFKKRETLILRKWKEQLRVCSGVGFEGPPDDGHSWRKYGQKHILGAKHPRYLIEVAQWFCFREYYRCTFRFKGCLAVKQVQRADEYPSIFDVTYHGNHTCRLWGQKHKKENLKKEEDEVDLKEEHFPSFSFFSTDESDSVEPRFFSNFIGTSYSISDSATSESYFSQSSCSVNNFGIAHSLQSSESDFLK